ncbi:multifunctional methyltransferase subunit TRM112-like protein [Temnothorax longispinosus]|uniref:multifunctional methyltransferase subunit TRM112-like protein n=1 Tax=Temnothorax longispinosus TaxID=300112 RepID=UPI003A99870F
MNFQINFYINFYFIYICVCVCVYIYFCQKARDIRVSEVDFNPEYIARIIPKLDWTVLWKAAESIGHVGELPQILIEDFETNEDFLKKAHHVLLEVEVINGDLLCPESNRKFPINDGIPNMLLNEDEV